jgi:metallo-beta-lactamase family protein
LQLTFHGAAGTVTGSRYLLETDDLSCLVDCGLFQGLKSLRRRNWDPPPFKAGSVDHVLLTHTHIDHSGWLPRLVKNGYRGPIHASEPTCELAEILLQDAAKIQEEDAAFANKKGFSKHKPALPLYTSEDALAALKLFRPVGYDRWLKLKGRGKFRGSGVRARFLNSGHILGASFVQVEIEARKGRPAATVVFSGDLGRTGVPLHIDPLPRPPCDVLVVESTYGDRRHDHTPIAEQIREPFLRCLERKGVVLIPAFAVGRSQMVTLILRRLMEAGELPEVPIHIDSPMAIDVTRIYNRHLHDCNLDEDLVEDGRTRLFPERVQFHRSVEDSKRLNEMAGPRVIISASGMMTGGRVVHHLGVRLPDPRNLLLLSGYQAAGTRGRSLLEGADSLRMHGMTVPVRAEWHQIHGLSSHADSDELMRWIRDAETLPRTVIVTHGEPESSQALAARIEEELGVRTVIPALGDRLDLSTLL